MSKIYLFILFVFCLSIHDLSGQQKRWSAADIKIHLEKLNTLGSVLYFAAHPDDENTRLIAWLAQEKKYRTGYLSLTRGEGGQNLIGTDLGVDLGLIRTQELLAARAIDKGEQFFSSAYDFGFSKTHQETFKFWDKERILAEAVYIIRKFRPDVIITRFPPDKRGGHGHHQASAILAHEAFIAAADPKRFPEQLETVKPWQATRLVWNTANFGGMNNTSEDQLKIDIGEYNPLLGQSYGEIAAQSRSQHKSQGFGAASTRGEQIEYFEHVVGKEAKKTLLDDVNTAWARISGTEKIQSIVDKVNKEFDAHHPERTVQDLFALRKEIQTIPDEYWRAQKNKEVEDLIMACAGIWVDVVTNQPQFVQSQEIPVIVEAIVRNPNTVVTIVKINQSLVSSLLSYNRLWKDQYNVGASGTTQPYWLRKPYSMGKYDVDLHEVGFPVNEENPALEITFNVGDGEIMIRRDIQYRSVDPVYGEVYQPIVILPELTVELSKKSLLSANTEEQEVPVIFTNNDNNIRYYEVLALSTKGWEHATDMLSLDFSKGNKVTKMIRVRPEAKGVQKGTISFINQGKELQQIKTISYPHISGIAWFPKAEINVEAVDLVNPVRKVAYIPGAGDLIPQSLSNIGIEVSTLSDSQIDADYLKQFDAVVIGVRYFNVNEKSGVALAQLLKYAEQGGVVLVQYNVNARLQTEALGPYPFRLTRDRVTEEDAKVDFDKNDPVFNYPNKITDADFADWVQERGLYFATNIDRAYRTPIRMHDTGEKASNGSLLIAKHGKGKFVYTSLSFFRQLPAGVPGAYRLFVNLLAKEK